MSIGGPQEWNFATVHPANRELANEDEQRINKKLYGGCMHVLWSRLQDLDGSRYARCDACGAEVYLHDDNAKWVETQRVMSDAEVRKAFLRSIPNTRYDDIVANEVLRKIEAAGWHCMIISKADRFACSMAKGDECFVSEPQGTKSAAITVAAGQVLKGKRPR